ncbi:MAG: hypothetical protein HOK17_00980, partial [Flammeovirgaceae bacterium]|nr:hypothetical protein [Flammeovirgaceae bacterium]
ISTGRHFAAIVSNDAELEESAIEAGSFSGDLVHPLPYCPELLSPEFKSKVADMKNSVKDRMNAQSSCAGHFVESHLVDYTGKWLHARYCSNYTRSSYTWLFRNCVRNEHYNGIKW